MPISKYPVTLSEAERLSLQRIISKGVSPARKVLHANVLLSTDENNPGGRLSNSQIAKRFMTSEQTVNNIRKAYATRGLKAALDRKKRETPPVESKVTGDIEARIIALSLSEPPEGRGRWTLRLLADKAVELRIIDSISHVKVGDVLKKTSSSRT